MTEALIYPMACCCWNEALLDILVSEAFSYSPLYAYDMAMALLLLA